MFSMYEFVKIQLNMWFWLHLWHFKYYSKLIKCFSFL